MGTISEIYAGNDPETGDQFRVYTDWLDDCVGSDVVHLEVIGSEFETSVIDKRPRTKLTLPRVLAEKMGLLPLGMLSKGRQSGHG